MVYKLNEQDCRNISGRIGKAVRRTQLYGFFLINSIVFGILAVLFPFLPLLEGASVSPLVCIVPAALCAIFVLGAVLVYNQIKKQGLKSARLDPTVVDISSLGAEKLNGVFCKYYGVEDLGAGKYGFLKEQKNVRLFVLEAPEYRETGYGDAKKDLEKTANKKYKIKSGITNSEASRAIKLNLLLLDRWSVEAQEAVSVNAAYGMNYVEGILDIFVDRAKMRMYVPDFAGDWYAGAAKYRFCVETLLLQMLKETPDGLQ